MKSSNFEQFKCLIEPFIINGKLSALSFLINGPYEYRAGLVIIANKRILEIVHVIDVNEHNLLLCQEYNLQHFNYSFNSIEIEERNSTEYELLNIDYLENKQTYDKQYCKNKLFIIADTLDVYNEFEM